MASSAGKALIGLDLGSSAVKGVAVSVDGEVLADAKTEVRLDYPQEGWIEFDADRFFERLCTLLSDLKHAAGDYEVAAVSMATASGNTLLLDGNHEPLAPAISWMDKRAKATDAEVLPDIDKRRVHSLVGWPWNDMFPLAHLGWLKQNRPEQFKQARYTGMNLNYIFYRLSGTYAADVSTATQLYLQDQVNQCWHEPYLQMLGISRTNLPELLQSGTGLGNLDHTVAEKTGLQERPLVVLGAFDHPCAARGTGTLTPGEMMLSCGTSWVGFYPLIDRRTALSQNMLIDPFLTPSGPWAGLFSLRCLGVCVNWCIDHLIAPNETDKERKYTLFNQYARESPPGAEGLTIRIADAPFSEDVSAKLRDSYTPQQLSRAVMESAVFEMRRKIEQLANAGIKADRVTMVGGPSESPVWPQILADVTGLRLNLVHGANAGALGAAVIAGKGAGYFNDEHDAASIFNRHQNVRHPEQTKRQSYDKLYHAFVNKYQGN